MAAAYGGFTGVLCMPNTSPPVDNVEVLSKNIEKSKGNIVSVFHSACATVERKGEKITDIHLLAKAGAMAITDDGSPVANDDIMKAVLFKTAEAAKPFVQHCEIMSITNGGIINEEWFQRSLGKGILMHRNIK
jgi:dihydroorotase